MRPSKIYEKYCDGDHLTNFKVLDGLKFFTDLATNLSLCGPVFRLAFLEANRIADRLNDIAKNRELI